MIAALAKALDNFFGRGEAAVTVPPMDGALRPNRRLDDAPRRLALADVDMVCSVGGALVASTGERLMEQTPEGWRLRQRFDTDIAALAPHAGGLAVALADGVVTVQGGADDGFRHDTGLRCITALASDGTALLIANGSDRHPARDWQRDLLERNAAGSVWRLAPAGGAAPEPVARGLAWPAGLAVDPQGPVVAEAWRHRLVRPGSGGHQVLLDDLPAYPGRLAPGGGGWWLALFAPRSQLVEFVLREPAYCRRMMAEVPQDYWVAPRLRSGRSFYESLQGGGVKQLGKLKPWAPSMSAGFCLRLDAGFQPQGSLQSRADGHTHGVTSACEHGGALWIAARGDGAVVVVPSHLAERPGGESE
ncbi:MAG: hypothetical protein ACK414_09930 [Gemmobacter sp.]